MLIIQRHCDTSGLVGSQRYISDTAHNLRTLPQHLAHLRAAFRSFTYGSDHILVDEPSDIYIIMPEPHIVLFVSIRY